MQFCVRVSKNGATLIHAQPAEKHVNVQGVFELNRIWIFPLLWVLLQAHRALVASLYGLLR